ncbi:hypothetical protein Ahy_B10g104344 [Arachis hypogaea]|uniref:DNA helicase Pif1-like 2B domain-containing protein n=1 Tax=Arachis hypogaea TaxID=3818 RepID=A0A444X5A3_ARAHY|nr:hypothetical protein Ahy_B10g104344 [Arachis hypogaea]
MVSFVYPDLLLNINNSIYFKERTILAPTLEVVHDVNNTMMGYLAREQKVYISSDSLCIEEGNMESELNTITTDVLNSINCSELPTHQLKLKVGVPVMLLRNIDQSKGFCNGTRLQLVDKSPASNMVVPGHACRVQFGGSDYQIGLHVARVTMEGLTWSLSWAVAEPAIALEDAWR